VANHGNGTLVRYDSAQLANGGPVEPTVIVSGVAHPTGLAFDAGGALWVSDNVANRLVSYSRGQLLNSGAPNPPRSVITPTNGSLLNPGGLAIDADGNLWVANLGSSTVASFTPAQQLGGGALVPHTTITSTANSLAVSTGLAFDGQGTLWVLGAAGTLTSFARASLGVSGAVEPTGRFSVTGHTLLWGAAFWPRPAGLPLACPAVPSGPCGVAPAASVLGR
jgi:secreted PhoX family phosphatase